MRKSFGYTRALTRAGDLVEASTYVKPSQSVVLKYGMGDGPQVRRPGDVGLARERILVPHSRNLALTQGINRNSYGNVPGGVAARLAREALGQRAKRRIAGRWGVYKGELDIGGSRVMGYIARPPRGEAPIGKKGRSIVVNLGRPRVLLVAIDQARYQPLMQAPYDAAVNEAVARIPGLIRRSSGTPSNTGRPAAGCAASTPERRDLKGVTGRGRRSRDAAPRPRPPRPDARRACPGRLPAAGGLALPGQEPVALARARRAGLVRRAGLPRWNPRRGRLARDRVLAPRRGRAPRPCRHRPRQVRGTPDLQPGPGPAWGLQGGLLGRAGSRGRGAALTAPGP